MVGVYEKFDSGQYEGNCVVCLESIQNSDSVAHNNEDGRQHPIHRKCAKEWHIDFDNMLCPACDTDINANSLKRWDERCVDELTSMEEDAVNGLLYGLYVYGVMKAATAAGITPILTTPVTENGMGTAAVAGGLAPVGLSLGYQYISTSGLREERVATIEQAVALARGKVGQTAALVLLAGVVVELGLAGFSAIAIDSALAATGAIGAAAAIAIPVLALTTGASAIGGGRAVAAGTVAAALAAGVKLMILGTTVVAASAEENESAAVAGQRETLLMSAGALIAALGTFRQVPQEGAKRDFRLKQLGIGLIAGLGTLGVIAAVGMAGIRSESEAREVAITAVAFGGFIYRRWSRI